MSPPMARSSSPRKVVPLSTGDEVRPPRAGTGPALTRRVFFCGVVVEGSERILPDGMTAHPDRFQEDIIHIKQISKSWSYRSENH